MKKILASLIALLITTQAFADVNINKIEALSSELTTLKMQLEEAHSEQKSAAVKLAISASAAAVLGGYSLNKVINPKGGDVGAMYDAGLGMLGLGATIVPVVYAGVQTYYLIVNTKAIPDLEKSIEAKQLELASAKKVLESLQ